MSRRGVDCAGFPAFCALDAAPGRGLAAMDGVAELATLDSERPRAAGSMSGIHTGKEVARMAGAVADGTGGEMGLFREPKI